MYFRWSISTLAWVKDLKALASLSSHPVYVQTTETLRSRFRRDRGFGSVLKTQTFSILDQNQDLSWTWTKVFSFFCHYFSLKLNFLFQFSHKEIKFLRVFFLESLFISFLLVFLLHICPLVSSSFPSLLLPETFTSLSLMLFIICEYFCTVSILYIWLSKHNSSLTFVKLGSSCILGKKWRRKWPNFWLGG